LNAEGDGGRGGVGGWGQGPWGVRGGGEFVRSETVIVGKAIEYPATRARMSVQLDWERHVEMDVPAVLLNHSCAPNLAVRENQWCAYDFVALRGIGADGELAFDYAMREYALAAPLSCLCGSAVCPGEIRPWSGRSEVWREQNAMWVAGYLRVGSALTTSAAAEMVG